MRRKRPAVLAVLLALVVLAAGCTMPGTGGGSDGGPGGDGGSGPDAATIQQKSLSAMQDVESVKMEMNMTIESNGQTFTSTSQGVVDVEHRRMRVTSSFQGAKSTVYVLNDTLYAQQNGRWQSKPVDPERYWNNTNVAQQRAFLSSDNVTVDGTATVDGEEVYVLRITPSEQELKKLVQRQQNVATENVEYEDVRMTMYVDTDTYHVRKSVASMTVKTQGQSARTVMTTTFSDFGRSFDIQPPAGVTSNTTG